MVVGTVYNGDNGVPYSLPDKKNIGGVTRFVLPVGIGDAGVMEDVAAAELEAAVGYTLARATERS